MNPELRRSQRYDEFLPISISVQNKDSGKTVAGPFSARISDISYNGVCLIMTQVMFESFHVFHSTRDDASLIFELDVNIPHELFNFEIPGWPIWFNSFQIGDMHAFKIGIDFLNTADKKQMHDIDKIISRL